MEPAMNTSYANEGDYLDRVKRMFSDSIDMTNEARALAVQDLDYYHGRQWTAEELRVLESRRQPPIVINRTRRKIDSIIGILERMQVDPRAYARAPGKDEAADVVTQALQFVADMNRFKDTKSLAFRDMMVQGTGAVSVEATQRRGDIDVTIRWLSWEELVLDPYSRRDDMSDATFIGTAKWMSFGAVGRYFGPEAEQIARATRNGNEAGRNTVDGSYNDRPNAWVESKKDRVLVVELYHQEGPEWRRCVFTGGGFLSPPQPSPYVDEEGRPTCPIIAESAYTDRENRRYGLARDMKGPQDEINHRRSKLLHLFNTRQTFSNDQATQNVDDLKRELHKPDGHVHMTAGSKFGEDFGIIPTTDMSAGNVDLLQEAKAEIELLGPNSGLMGRGTEGQSGRAILAQQQAGLGELSAIFGRFRSWELRVYRAVWDRIRQFWTAPKYVRVTNDADAPKFIMINQPVLDVFGNPQIDPMTGQVAVENSVAEMDVDIVIDVTADTASLQQEQFDTLVRLRELGEPIPPGVIIEASTLPNKRRLLDKLEEAQKAPPPPQVVAGLEKTRSEVRKNDADAAVKEQQVAHEQIAADMVLSGQHPAMPAGLNLQPGPMPGPEPGPPMQVPAMPPTPQPSPFAGAFS